MNLNMESLRKIKDQLSNVQSALWDLENKISDVNMHKPLQLLLLKGSVDPNVTDGNGNTPLHFAETPKETRLLLLAGANPNLQNTFGDTPLHYAKTPEQVKLLLKEGADTTIENRNGVAPTEFLMFSNDEGAKVIRSFIENKNKEKKIEKVDKVIEEVVEKVDSMKLFKCKTLEETKSLLDQGADPNVRNYYHNTPIFVSNDPKKIKLLLERGAETEIVNTKYRNAYCHHLHMGRESCAKTIKDFIENKKSNNENGDTREEVVEKVVEKVDSMKLFDCTTAEETKALLEKGADPNIKNYIGQTPLHCAKTLEQTKLLLDYDTEPGVVDNCGFTPLHYTKSPEQVKMLLEAGANTTITNVNGRNSYRYQIYMGRESCAKAIKSFIENKKTNNENEKENEKKQVKISEEQMSKIVELVTKEIRSQFLKEV